MIFLSFNVTTTPSMPLQLSRSPGACASHPSLSQKHTVQGVSPLSGQREGKGNVPHCCTSDKSLNWVPVQLHWAVGSQFWIHSSVFTLLLWLCSSKALPSHTCARAVLPLLFWDRKSSYWEDKTHQRPQCPHRSNAGNWTGQHCRTQSILPPIRV